MKSAPAAQTIPGLRRKCAGLWRVFRSLTSEVAVQLVAADWPVPTWPLRPAAVSVSVSFPLLLGLCLRRVSCFPPLLGFHVLRLGNLQRVLSGFVRHQLCRALRLVC